MFCYPSDLAIINLLFRNKIDIHTCSFIWTVAKYVLSQKKCLVKSTIKVVNTVLARFILHVRTNCLFYLLVTTVPLRGALLTKVYILFRKGKDHVFKNLNSSDCCAMSQWPKTTLITFHFILNILSSRLPVVTKTIMSLVELINSNYTKKMTRRARFF